MSAILLPTRAEEIDNKIHDYFVFPTPRYEGKLLSNKTTIIVGGRGTGKTMLLKSLAMDYILKNQSAYELHKDDKFIGCYIRADNRITSSFMGRGIGDEEWTGLFEHYFNLVVTRCITKTLINLHRRSPISNECIQAYCQRFMEITEDVLVEKTLEEIEKKLRKMLDRFVAYFNNPHRVEKPLLIYNGYLFTELCVVLIEYEDFSDRTFFVLIDEYESMPKNIQRVVNTLVKSNQRPIIFKIAMRPGGWWTKETLSSTEPLDLTADYETIIFEDMEEKEYLDFIKRLSKRLLINAGLANSPFIDDVEKLFPGLSLEDEILNIFKRSNRKAEFITKIEEYITKKVEPDQVDEVKNKLIDVTRPLLTRLHLVLLDRGTNPMNLYHDALRETAGYKEWYHHNKTGITYLFCSEYPGVAKQYTGFDTFVSLSSRIVRNFLSLLSSALSFAIVNGFNVHQPRPFTFEEQSKAAYYTSGNKLDEIRGYPACGADLYAMTHALGRMIEQLNKSKLQSQPEINHISIKGTLSVSAKEKLDSAILFSVLQEQDASKLKSEQDTRTKDYLLNRVYCPHYHLSFRKMHKLDITAAEFEKLVCGTQEEREAFILAKLRELQKKEMQHNQTSLYD